MEFGESIQEATIREVEEETGICIEYGEPFHAVDYIDTSTKEHFVIVNSFAFADGIPIAKSDVLKTEWFDIDSKPDESYCTSHLDRIIRKGLLILRKEDLFGFQKK